MLMILGCIAAFLGYMSAVVWWMDGYAYSAMAWAENMQPLAGLIVGTAGVLLAVLSRTNWRADGR